MSLITDQFGAPLDGEHRDQSAVDALTTLCEKYSSRPGAWDTALERLETTLSMLEPQAPVIQKMFMGEFALDATKPEGQALVRLTFEVALLSLIFRRKAEIDDERERKALEARGA